MDSEPHDIDVALQRASAHQVREAQVAEDNGLHGCAHKQAPLTLVCKLRHELFEVKNQLGLQHCGLARLPELARDRVHWHGWGWQLEGGTSMVREPLQAGLQRLARRARSGAGEDELLHSEMASGCLHRIAAVRLSPGDPGVPSLDGPPQGLHLELHKGPRHWAITGCDGSGHAGGNGLSPGQGELCHLVCSL